MNKILFKKIIMVLSTIILFSASTVYLGIMLTTAIGTNDGGTVEASAYFVAIFPALLGWFNGLLAALKLKLVLMPPVRKEESQSAINQLKNKLSVQNKQVLNNTNLSKKEKLNFLKTGSETDVLLAVKDILKLSYLKLDQTQKLNAAIQDGDYVELLNLCKQYQPQDDFIENKLKALFKIK